MRMILASSSPRRKELLGIAGFTFEIIRPDVDETPKRGKIPRSTPFALRGRKRMWCMPPIPMPS